MAVSVHCTGIVVNENGTGRINYSDVQVEFSSLADLQLIAADLDDPVNLDLARRFLIAWWIARNPAADNPSFIIGKTLTLDMTTAEMIVVEAI